MKNAARSLLDEVKHIPGWRTGEKLVVFAVDDYGTVRLDSASARDRMEARGLRFSTRFDRLDAVETRDDVELLFDVLSSVTDGNGRHAVFTPYALSANPDFEALQADASEYRYKPVDRTFVRLAAEQPQAYEGAWDLWLQGTRDGLLRPQFHGREHLNVELLERQLRAKDAVLMLNIANRSMAALNDEPTLPGVSFTHAYNFYDRAELPRHHDTITGGLRLFEQIYGHPSTTFTPPAQRLDPELHETLERNGVRAIHKPLFQRRRIHRDTYVRELNWLGRRRGQGHTIIVRNVLFEPNDKPGVDSVGLALQQIAAAFRWRKPAVVSSHRVNYCGHIDESNRTRGLADLKRLFQSIVTRWPDVQFIGADELVTRIEGSS
jgi:hypothetical protein